MTSGPPAGELEIGELCSDQPDTGKSTPTPGSGGSVPPEASQKAALWRLGAVLAAAVIAAAVLHGWAVLVVVVALVAMVMLHELGHFAAAKWSGMKVTEYFLGFGPRLWSIRRGETEYGVKAIPAGGYVRIIGMTSAEEVAPEDEPRAYRQATFPRRLAVAVAGSFMHFVMAFVLLWALFAFAGVPTLELGRTVGGIVSLAGVTSPARVAGLRSGDTIVAVDGQPMRSGSSLVTAIEHDANKRITLTVRRHGHTLVLHATPLDGRHVRIAGTSSPVKSGPSPVGFLGIDLSTVTVGITVNPADAVVRGAQLLGTVTAQTGQGIAKVFSLHGLSSFVHDVATANQHPQPSAAGGSAGSGSAGSTGSSGQILSIYGAGRLAVQAAEHDISELLYLLVAINVFVGMVNLFPMLPLDGGHVVIAVYERIRSRRGRRYHANVNKLMPIAYLFLAFIVVIGLSALYANILNPPSLGG